MIHPVVRLIKIKQELKGLSIGNAIDNGIKENMIEKIFFLVGIIGLFLIIYSITKWLTNKYWKNFCKVNESKADENFTKKKSDKEEFRMNLCGIINSLIFIGGLIVLIFIFNKITNLNMKNLILWSGLFSNFFGGLVFVFGAFEPSTYFKRFKATKNKEILSWAKEKNIQIITGLLLFIYGFLIIFCNTIF